jgi:endonuclease YncB( thermonuclease family)
MYTRTALALALALASAGSTARATSEERQGVVRDALCIVQAVVEGDTLRCADGRLVRLLLVDAPAVESGALGVASRSALLALTPVGTRLRLEFDVEPDDGYHHTLAYAYLADGRMVNELMARAGRATVYIFPPNTRHAARIRAAVRAARAERQGMWVSTAGACSAVDHRLGIC